MSSEELKRLNPERGPVGRILRWLLRGLLLLPTGGLLMGSSVVDLGFAVAYVGLD